MIGSSRVRAAGRGRESGVGSRESRGQRARKLAAAALCAASFLAGELLFGAESAPAPLRSSPPAAPQTIWNQYLKREPGVESREGEPPAEPWVQGSGFRVQEGEINALRPAAIQPIENPLVKKKEPGVRSRGTGIRSQGPEITLTPPHSGTVTLPDLPTEPKRIDAQPLELAAPLNAPLTPLAIQHSRRNATEGVPHSAADESLPPIVPASAMPRRPNRESGVGGRGSGEKPAQAPWMQEIRAALDDSPR